MKNGKLTTLVLDIALPLPVPPNSNGGKYSIAPQISLIPNAGSSPSVNSFMALLQGSVSGIPSGIHENATVEPAGTSNQIATAKVKGGKYVMQVPVAASGTSYDLFAFGAGNSYDLITPAQPAPAQPLTRGTSYIVNFTVKSAQTGKLTGTISDACAGAGGGATSIEGATIDLLASSDGTDCTIVPTPTNCAVVASTSTKCSAIIRPRAAPVCHSRSISCRPPTISMRYGSRLRASIPRFRR